MKSTMSDQSQFLNLRFVVVPLFASTRFCKVLSSSFSQSSERMNGITEKRSKQETKQARDGNSSKEWRS